jgi:putative ABC transport system substrate-binding protein
MRRREFIAGLGSAAAWPVVARAQQPAVPVIGYLDSKRAAAVSHQVAAFRHGLNEAGFVEGHNVAIEFRWADGQRDRLPELAAYLVQRRVAALVTDAAATPAAKAATSTIPIVFVSGADPIEAGLVISLNRPTGNVTGVSYTAAPLNPKRLELLHELVPEPGLIGVLMEPNFSKTQLPAIQGAASSIGRPILTVEAGTESEIDAAFATIVQAGARALFVGAGPVFNSRRRQLVALAAHHALPASYHLSEFVAAGGLMSYGASDTEACRQGGLYVGRILKGAKPSELPVELPTKYKLVFNLATAKALKLNIPAKLLALADEVLE